MDRLEGQLCPLSLWQVAPYSISFSAVYSCTTLTMPDEGWGLALTRRALQACFSYNLRPGCPPVPCALAPWHQAGQKMWRFVRHKGSHAWGNLTAGCIRGISFHEPQLSHSIDSPEDTLGTGYEHGLKPSFSDAPTPLCRHSQWRSSQC